MRYGRIHNFDLQSFCHCWSQRSRAKKRRKWACLGTKKTETRTVDPPASFKSPVWQYFGFGQITSNKGVRETVKTKRICEGSVSYSSGNTSNMSTHLKRKHPEITLQKPESKPRNPTAEQAKAKPQTASNLTSTPGQLWLHEVMQSKLSQNSPTNIPLNPTF